MSAFNACFGCCCFFLPIDQLLLMTSWIRLDFTEYSMWFVHTWHTLSWYDTIISTTNVSHIDLKLSLCALFILITLSWIKCKWFQWNWKWNQNQKRKFLMRSHAFTSTVTVWCSCWWWIAVNKIIKKKHAYMLSIQSILAKKREYVHVACRLTN